MLFKTTLLYWIYYLRASSIVYPDAEPTTLYSQVDRFEIIRDSSAPDYRTHERVLQAIGHSARIAGMETITHDHAELIFNYCDTDVREIAKTFTSILQTLHFPYGGCVAGEDAK